MKSIVFVYAACMMVLSSCKLAKTSSEFHESTCEKIDKVDTTEVFQTQTEINEECYDMYQEDQDSVDNETLLLLKALPKHQSELKRERTAWEKYLSAVKAVATQVDQGSSSPMYVNDVLRQALKLRSISQHGLYLQTQGVNISFSKTNFTPDMISEAYSAFINAVGEDEYNDKKADYQKALQKEQGCWDEWMECRESVSKKLIGDEKDVYDKSSNQMMRTKLYQLKNQNQGLGMGRQEIFDCALPSNCSDKALLEYPGFNNVWARHCKDTDWYPVFE